MADFETSERVRRRVGLQRLAGLLEELRRFGQLRERRPGDFQIGTRPVLHFHYHADGSIVTDVRLSKHGIEHFDVSDTAGQYELLAAVEEHLRHV
jgi:hypothetical protein